MTHHEKLKKEAQDALKRLFSDLTVSANDTKDSLIELREEIDVMVEAIEIDIQKES